MKGTINSVAISLILLLSWAMAAVADAACPRKITTSSPFVNLPCREDDPRWGEAFAHWDRRENKDDSLAAVRLFEPLAKDHPDQIEARLWVMRGYYAAGMRCRGAEQTAWMRKAAAAGDQALALDPGNEIAKYWRWMAMIFFHQLTDAELAEVRAFGMSHQAQRELPVPGDDPLWSEALRHWDARAAREELAAAIERFTELEAKYPSRIEPKLWLARSTSAMNYYESEESARAKWSKTAADWAERALAIEPRNPAANYLSAAALGSFGSHTGFSNFVRYAPTITSRLLLVVEEDPNYNYGAAEQFFWFAIARAPTIVPKMLELIGFSQTLIENDTIFAYHYEPRCLRTAIAVAQMDLVKGKIEEAKKVLEEILAADPAAVKALENDNRGAQRAAKRILDKSFPPP